MNEAEMIKKIIPHLGEKMCELLNIEPSRVHELLGNFAVESKLSGHNNEIFFLNFYNAKKVLLGKACFKCTAERKKESKLQIESVILNILKSEGIACPMMIDVGLNEKGVSFILMEVISGTLASDCVIDISIAESILNTILLHESILLDSLETLQYSDNNLGLHQIIDFEKKLKDYLKSFTPHLIIKSSYNFLNNYLNEFNTIKRSIVTDRSTDNIFIGEDNKITMIDFSTLRVGSQFDNWVQFIDDPRAKFSCSKEELIKLFFEKNNLPESLMDFYYVSSIYTNILQGIFTYKKDPGLSRQYIDNANNAFERFNKKKGMLIDIGH